jgi:hypothetical protein
MPGRDAYLDGLLGIEFLNHARAGVRPGIPSERFTEMASESKAAAKAGCSSGGEGQIEAVPRFTLRRTSYFESDASLVVTSSALES